MSVEINKVTYSCDWTLESGELCEATGVFGSKAHDVAARDAGWGWYENAHIRWEKWGAGHRNWFCPVHSTQFRANHGWGHMETYGPPTKWWKNIFRA